jgi:hypothetical protein
MNLPPERIEAHCPNCQAAFVTTPMGRRKKIQCPKCREVILLTQPPEPGAIRLPTVEEFEELKHRVARHEALIEKLLAREVRTAEAPIAGPPGGDSLLCPGTSLRWLRRAEDPAGSADVDAEQQAVLLHNLRAMGQREVVMRSTHEDAAAWRLGERLSELFREAGWNVEGPDQAPERAHDRGLVLAAGDCPLPKAASATYMALKASGFPITSRLDADLRPDQAVLIAGRFHVGAC